MLCRLFLIYRAADLYMRKIISLVRCLSIKSPIRSGMVIMADPCVNLMVSLKAIIKGIQIHALIFQVAPEPFDKHIVHTPPLPSIEILIL